MGTDAVSHQPGRWWRWALLLGSIALAVVALGLASPRSAAAADDPIVVCDTCAVTSLAEALESAPTGTTVEVHGGVHPGGLVFERPVRLIGIDDPVIDSGGKGTVLHIVAEDVTIQGFTLRGTGTSLDREDTGILIEGARATVLNNRVEDALFGIYLKNAPGSVVRDNVVEAKDLPLPLRGDGIRIWYCDDVVIERNTVRDGRDVILWYSNRGLIRDNIFERGRYGLHLMFSDQAEITGNSLRGNSVGAYIMYSRDSRVVGNTLADNHGPSGGGLGLKDVDGAIIEENRFASNQIGVQIDNSPRERGIEHVFRRNVFAYNAIGIGFLPSVRHNTLTENVFTDNIENVAVLGGGQLRDITWSVDGRGNYWSDYVGYDADGDGIGDVPYRSQRLFESLMDRHQGLRLFLFSPAATAIDFAARAFPAVRPEIKLEDTAPLMQPVLPAGLPAADQMPLRDRWLAGMAGVAAAIGALVMIGALRRQAHASYATHHRKADPTPPEPLPATAGAPRPSGSSPSGLISLRAVTKRYGKTTAVDRVSFDVQPGEAIALWGPNGAGKSTVLRCLLGIARYDGEITVAGRSPRSEGRLVRQQIGFVPQHLPIPAMTVGELLRFIAELKRVPEADAWPRLDQLGIAEQADKEVQALSGGMRQRLALALALIGGPPILLLDEPTASLDARGRAELLELLRQLKRAGITMVFSSHRPEDVLMLADRILMLKQGALLREITPSQFLEELETGARLVLYLDEGQREPALTALDRLGLATTATGDIVSVTLNGHTKGQVLGSLARAGVGIQDFEVERGPWTGQS